MAEKLNSLKVSDSVAYGLKIQKLTDRPTAATHYGGDGLSAHQLKAKFDALGDEVRKALNGLISLLGSADIANEIKVEYVDETEKTLAQIIERIDDGGLAYDLRVKKDAASPLASLQSVLYAIDKYITDTKTAMETADNGINNSLTVLDNSVVTLAQSLSQINGDAVKKSTTSRQTVKGDLEVKTLFTDSPYIVCQSNGQRDWAYLIFPDGDEYYGSDHYLQDAYAIAFDRSTKTVRLGAALLSFDEAGENLNYVGFGYKDIYNPKEFAQAIATRADTIGDKHIAVWDASKSMFVDSGRSVATLANEVMAELTGGAPEALDTLKELADALGNDKNFSTTVMTKIGALESAIGDISTALDEIIALGEFYTGATFDELHEYALNVAKGGSQ